MTAPASFSAAMTMSGDWVFSSRTRATDSSRSSPSTRPPESGHLYPVPARRHPGPSPPGANVDRQ